MDARSPALGVTQLGTKTPTRAPLPHASPPAISTTTGTHVKRGPANTRPLIVQEHAPQPRARCGVQGHGKLNTCSQRAPMSLKGTTARQQRGMQRKLNVTIAPGLGCGPRAWVQISRARLLYQHRNTRQPTDRPRTPTRGVTPTPLNPAPQTEQCHEPREESEPVR